MAAKSVWGVDIGQTSLKAIRLGRDDAGSMQILGFDVIEHPSVLSQPELDQASVEQMVDDALAKFVAKNDVLSSEIVVGLPGKDTLAKFTRLPPVEPAQIPKIVEFEAGQQIPFPLDEVVWDYQTFSSPGSPDIDAGIFAVKREVVAARIAHFRKLNLAPSIVQANSLALLNFAAYDGHLASEGATVLIDIATEMTDLVIVHGEKVFQRQLTIGGNSFTQALVSSFKLSFSKAEALKRTAEQSKYAKQVYQAMKPVFSDLVTEINRSVGYFSTQNRDSRVTRFVLVGSSFRFPGLTKFLAQNLSGEVVHADRFLRLTGPIAQSPNLLAAAPCLAAAYGMALQPFGLAKIQANLLPVELAREQLWKKKTPLFVAAAACLGIAAVVMWTSYALASAEYSSATPQREATAAVIKQAEDLRRQFDEEREAGRAQVRAGRSMLELQNLKDKALVPLIYSIIAQAVPVPQRLREASASAEAYRDALVLLSARRSERPVLYIDSLSVNYVVERTETASFGSFDAFDDSAAQPAAKPTEKRHFNITITGRTPRGPASEARTVVNTFYSNIRNAVARTGVEATPFLIDPDNTNQLQVTIVQNRRDTAASAGGPLIPPGGAGAAPAQGIPDPLFDPEAGEDVSGDHLFRMTFRLSMRPVDPPADPAAQTGN